MRLLILTSIITVLLSSCQEIAEAPVPNTYWEAFTATGTQALPATERGALQGLYTIDKGADFFGPRAVGRWSYTLTGKDTTWHLSFFMEDEASYLVMEARRAGEDILLNGYWRKMVNTETGKVQLTLSGREQKDKPGFLVTGVFGNGEEEPREPLAFRHQGPLPNGDSLQVIAHRGGGRNNDLLPASENSVEMLKLASRFGATGVEIDVKLSKDGVPVLYHDDQINDRLTEKPGIRGALSEYTYKELSGIQLKRGGRIPSLEQGLDTILYKTPLQFVWLDCKLQGSLEKVRELQQRYMEKARAAGRRLTILIGIPDEEAMKSFTQLKDFRSVLSLTELDTSLAIQLGANAWAPSWTKGLQLPVVTAMQQRGKSVIVWTVDLHDKIEEFIRDGKFNGIVSNRPSMVSYYYYIHQGKYSK